MFTRKKLCGAGVRRLVVVDLENVVGGAVLNPAAVRWAKALVTDAVGLCPGDHVVVGVSHVGLLVTGCSWPDLRYVLGSGLDGADRALLAVLEEQVAERYTHLVVVSGDGIFTEPVSELVASGVEVTVVAHPDKLAKRLRMAAHHVSHLTAPAFPDTLDAA